MRIHLTGAQSMLRPQTQSPMRPAMGQTPYSGLESIIQQVNASYGGRKNQDTVELSQAALELLETGQPKAAGPAKELEAAFGPQKYAPGMFTKEEWAEQSVLAQLDGLQTVSDIVGYARSKLDYTMSKISELEQYLNGTGTHSDPNMTKELAETYLHNYRQSIQSDYTALIQSHLNPHRSAVEEYDALSGGLASQVTENRLDSISAEALGLSNLPDDPQEIRKALEHASRLLEGMMRDVENTYQEMAGVQQMPEPPRSTSIFTETTSHDFFASQMERSHRVLDTAQMKLTGETLRFPG